MVYEDSGDFKNALKFQEKSMKIRGSYYSDKSDKRLAESYKYVGDLHKALGDAQKGAQFIQKTKQVYANINREKS